MFFIGYKRETAPEGSDCSTHMWRHFSKGKGGKCLKFCRTNRNLPAERTSARAGELILPGQKSRAGKRGLFDPLIPPHGGKGELFLPESHLARRNARRALFLARRARARLARHLSQ